MQDKNEGGNDALKKGDSIRQSNKEYNYDNRTNHGRAPLNTRDDSCRSGGMRRQNDFIDGRTNDKYRNEKDSDGRFQQYGYSNKQYRNNHKNSQHRNNPLNNNYKYNNYEYNNLQYGNQRQYYTNSNNHGFQSLDEHPRHNRFNDQFQDGFNRRNDGATEFCKPWHGKRKLESIAMNFLKGSDKKEATEKSCDNYELSSCTSAGQEMDRLELLDGSKKRVLGHENKYLDQTKLTKDVNRQTSGYYNKEEMENVDADIMGNKMHEASSDAHNTNDYAKTNKSEAIIKNDMVEQIRNANDVFNAKQNNDESNFTGDVAVLNHVNEQGKLQNNNYTKGKEIDTTGNRKDFTKGNMYFLDKIISDVNNAESNEFTGTSGNVINRNTSTHNAELNSMQNKNKTTLNAHQYDVPELANTYINKLDFNLQNNIANKRHETVTTNNKILFVTEEIQDQLEMVSKFSIFDIPDYITEDATNEYFDGVFIPIFKDETKNMELKDNDCTMICGYESVIGPSMSVDGVGNEKNVKRSVRNSIIGKKLKSSGCTKVMNLAKKPAVMKLSPAKKGKILKDKLNADGYCDEFSFKTQKSSTLNGKQTNNKNGYLLSESEKMLNVSSTWKTYDILSLCNNETSDVSCNIKNTPIREKSTESSVFTYISDCDQNISEDKKHQSNISLPDRRKTHLDTTFDCLNDDVKRMRPTNINLDFKTSESVIQDHWPDRKASRYQLSRFQKLDCNQIDIDLNELLVNIINIENNIFDLNINELNSSKDSVNNYISALEEISKNKMMYVAEVIAGRKDFSLENTSQFSNHLVNESISAADKSENFTQTRKIIFHADELQIVSNTYFLKYIELTQPTLTKSEDLREYIAAKNEKSTLSMIRNEAHIITKKEIVPVEYSLVKEIAIPVEGIWTEKENSIFIETLKDTTHFRVLQEKLNKSIKEIVLHYYRVKRFVFSPIKKKVGRISDEDMKFTIERDWDTRSIEAFTKHFNIKGKDWNAYKSRFPDKSEKDLKLLLRYINKYNNLKPTIIKESIVRDPKTMEKKYYNSFTVSQRQVFAATYPQIDGNWNALATIVNKTVNECRGYYRYYFKKLSSAERKFEEGLRDLERKTSSTMATPIRNEEGDHNNFMGIIFRHKK